MNHHFFHCMIECLKIEEFSFLLFLFLCEVVKDISFPTCQLLSPDSVRKSYPRGEKLTFSRCLGVGNLTLASNKMSNSPGSARPPPPPPPILGLHIDRCITLEFQELLEIFEKRSAQASAHLLWQA